jgi:hypothetical protein
MMAAYHGQLEVVRALTDHGADPNAVDIDGDTAVMLAEHSGHDDIVRLLVARGAKTISQALATGVSALPLVPNETSVGTVESASTKSNASVRTLHEPPEIWDLVHETRTDFNPRSAFVGRLASRNGLLLALAVLIVGGGAVFGFLKLKGSAVNPPAASPVRADDNKPKAVSNSPATESVKTSAASDQSRPDTAPAAVPNTSKDNQVPVTTDARNNVANIPTAEKAVVTAASSTKRVDVKPRRQTTSTTTIEPTAARTDSQEKAFASPSSAAKTGSEKDATTSTPRKEPEKAASPQSTSPAKANPTPKAKVIQWP